MIELDNTDRYIVNQLIDRELFTAIPGPKATKLQINAVHTFQNGYKQRRVANFFQTLIGTSPLNFGNNLVLMIGPNELDDQVKHVLLATLKVIISSPQMDGLESDMVIDSPSVIHQVQSEVTELDEQRIYEIIDGIFVKRFGLLTPDYPEGSVTTVQTEIMDPFWDIDPSFISITHEFIHYLTHQSDMESLTTIQQLNRILLQQRFFTPRQRPKLWAWLIENKVQLSKDWQPLNRFRLEVGNDYAVLLDSQQHKREAKPFIVAIALANKMGATLAKTAFPKQVRQVAKDLFPGRTINASDVKKGLLENALVLDKGDYFERTPVAKRFRASNIADIPQVDY
ncbi:MAG: hypothetical protein LKF37_06420 [Lentilactobacillus diolivorans]|jgi:hypothetical protein|nr:hypothetical protein [Lentilactobacillus diolivorans]RRG03378.1 MAG: hypothetical protein DUD34_05615 [Lactobacillus sp.]